MVGHRPSDWHVLDLEKDPTPGDPQRVRTLAKTLHDFADDVSEALRLVKGMAGESTLAEWAGKSATVFKEEFDGVPKNLKKLEKSYGMCGDALADFWPKLERAQTLADKALIKAREARDDLTSAQSKLSSADSWVTRASKEADKYKDDPTGSKSDADKPDEAKVRAATRDVQHAKTAHDNAQSAVNDAQSALDAAKKMAEDARKMRDDAAREAKNKIDEASDAGIQNRSWWEDVGDWFSDNWDTIVAVCKVVVAVVGIIAMVIGGPILGAIVLVAALVVLADTLYKYSKGQASLWDVGLAALDCVPGMKGLTSLGGLAKGLKALGKTGLKGMAKAARGGMGKLRRQAQLMAERRCKSDPVDVITGDMVASAVDVELLGAHPLTFVRHYCSSFRGGRWFGPSWGSVLDERLLLDRDGVRLITADGMVLQYPVPESDAAVLPVMGPKWPLVWSGGPGGDMQVRRPGDGETYHFRTLPGMPPAELRLTGVTDRNGNSIALEYEENGNPRAVVRKDGYRVGIEVSDGHVTALRLESDSTLPVLCRYRYDQHGNLSEIYNSSAQPLVLSYDREHRIVGWRDRNGTEYRYEYDAHGRCVRTIGSDGYQSGTFRYDPAAGETVHVDSLGHATTFRYNRDLRITAEINALGNSTATEWDEDGRVLTETDALGRTTRYTYDAQDNLRTVIRPDGSHVTAEHGVLGLPERVVEADGSQWSFEYDTAGNLLSITDPANATARYTYGESGRLLAATNALGAEEAYAYDSFGRVVSHFDALGAETKFTYDSFGRMESTTDSLGHVTRYGWTLEGLMAWRTSSDGAREHWTYDGEGNETEHHDAVGGVTTSQYTHFGLLASRTQPDGARLSFRHDTELRLTSVTDARSREWSYTYDAVGNLVGERDFFGRALEYAYDAADQLVTRTNALGRSTHYRHDLMGNVIEQRSGDGVARYSYDALGRMARAENADSVVILERDPVGRIVAESCNGRTLRNKYDALGRRIHRHTPGGAFSVWEYDAADRPTALHTGSQSLTVRYDAAGRETERRTGPMAMAQRWDGYDRLVEQRLLDVHKEQFALLRQYSYRADDHLVEVADSFAGRRRFELDAGTHVTAVRADHWSEQYAYDPAGDVSHGDWPLSAAQGDARSAVGDRGEGSLGVRRAGRTTYEHDAQGRMTRRVTRALSGSRRVWEYAWNDQDQLREVVTPDGARWQYLYDGLGRRIAKQLMGDDGGSRERVDFTWDGTDLAEQASATEDRVVSWDWSPHTGDPLVQTERPCGPELSQREVDTRFYAIVTDLVGAPTELVSPDGDIGWRLRTTLWGLPVDGSGGSTDCPLRFPGQYHDPETGLHYNYFRYYDPGLGRYCSLDPLGLAGGPNPAWYTPNPTAWIDPFGLALCRKRPRLETGDLKKGWLHIESRHITGTNPSTKHADMLPPGTTREQVHAAARKAVRNGTRISDPGRRIQNFQKRMKVNGMYARFQVTVDSHDGNNIITFFPVDKSAV
ncbi:RHS repeat-associated core domain-containing protein [Streptomyces anthocyanicus]|uniref:RHS repeat-associated core domain-containing protein n=1 Tax=Streptomyces anthocyanicus TaxID=68174 RepID=UPI0036E600E7